jgi:hypothetical protein
VKSGTSLPNMIFILFVCDSIWCRPRSVNSYTLNRLRVSLDQPSVESPSTMYISIYAGPFNGSSGHHRTSSSLYHDGMRAHIIILLCFSQQHLLGP